MNMCYDKDLKTGGGSPVRTGPEAGMLMGDTLLSVRGLLGSFAHDRRALLSQTWRASNNGSIVLADRYPSIAIGPTESSHFDDQAIERCNSPVNRWLMRCERAFYEDRPLPGLVKCLAAPIETTIHRDAERVKEGGPDRAALERRWEMETEAEYSDCNVVCVNTDQPLDETLNTVRQEIWSNVYQAFGAC